MYSGVTCLQTRRAIFSGQESKLHVPGVARASLDSKGFLSDLSRGYSPVIPGIGSPYDPAAISASRRLDALERRPPSAPQIRPKTNVSFLAISGKHSLTSSACHGQTV